MHFRCVFTLLQCCVLVGLDWAKPIMYLSLHVTYSCIRIFISLYSYILMCLVLFCVSLFLPLSLFQLVASCHLNENPLYPRTLFVLEHPLLLLTLHLLMYGSVMIKLERTFRRNFVNEAFIQNAKSSYWIFPILTYLLSFTVGVGGHYVISQSLVPP